MMTQSMSFADYQALAGLNFSSAKWLRVSPKHFHHHISHTRQPSKGMQLGTAVHCAVLEPDRFAREYACFPEIGDLRTKEARRAKEEWMSKHVGKTMIPYEEWDYVDKMSAAIQSSAGAHLLEGTWREVSLQWDEKGTLLKGRIDAVGADGRIVGLKTTRDLTRFQREVIAYGYHLQWAWYARGIKQELSMRDYPEVYEIVVESLPPFDCVTYRVPPEQLAAASKEVDALLARYRECSDSMLWPGISSAIVDFELPTWYHVGPEATIDFTGIEEVSDG